MNSNGEGVVLPDTGPRVKCCTRCKDLKPRGEFYKKRRNRDGLGQFCKECNKIICDEARKRRQKTARDARAQLIAEGAQRKCSQCKVVQPITAFSADKNCPGGTTYLCKSCCAKNGGSISGRYSILKCNAKSRGLEVGMTKEEYGRFMADKACFYCSGPLNKYGSGLDRKDSSRGYFLDNVVPCCWECNMAKSDVFSYEEMVLFLGPAIRKIREWRKQRSVGHEPE